MLRVLQFEGDRYHAHRVLRAAKNRFGSTNELGVFEMTGTGLVGVPDPSEVCIDPGHSCRFSTTGQPAHWVDLPPGTYTVHVDNDQTVPAYQVTVALGVYTYNCPLAPPWNPC